MRSIGPCMTRCATLLSHAFNILIIQICGTLGSHNCMLDMWHFFFFLFVFFWGWGGFKL